MNEGQPKIPDSTLSDAVIGRFICNFYWLERKGDSLQKDHAPILKCSVPIPSHLMNHAGGNTTTSQIKQTWSTRAAIRPGFHKVLLLLVPELSQALGGGVATS